MEVLRVGDVRVHHVEEWQGNFPMPPSAFFQGYDEATFRAIVPDLTPAYYRDDADCLYAFLQSWVLQVDGLTVLYDTGAGNAKERPGIPLFGGLETPFLDRLAAAGFGPRDIDVVVCSHLHIDHVGWNTHLHEGRWLPTFPNARYLFSAIERDYWDPRGPGPRPTPGGAHVNTNVFEDSVQPLLDAGVATLVDGGHRVSESITLELGPGHTPGHLIMDVRSRGESALFVGDILHHPVQVHRPDWNSPFCEDQEQARRTRRRVLELAAEREALLVPAHFGGEHCCRVRRDADTFVPIFQGGHA
ncbi:MAG: fold metallo-hydrolase [Steroidobacteraceae bacterium]|nr:fold metallo-hydrolase [Steroidobacteraceae bacterium]